MHGGQSLSFVAFLTWIAHFQKEWKTGARAGARSVMGSFGGVRVWKSTCAPQTIPLLNAHPPSDLNSFWTLNSFWKWALITLVLSLVVFQNYFSHFNPLSKPLAISFNFMFTPTLTGSYVFFIASLCLHSAPYLEVSLEEKRWTWLDVNWRSLLAQFHRCWDGFWSFLLRTVQCCTVVEFSLVWGVV